MRAKKQLGQHFLRDAAVLQDIAETADLQRATGALEIGPGEGALTAWLLQQTDQLEVLDADPRAIEAIEARFGDRVKAHLGDATTAPLESFLPEKGGVIVGNLPYNVASPIHRRILGLFPKIERAVLMFQLEVAQRIVAKAGDPAFGIPSILTAVVANSWITIEVPPEAFSPRPKVQSAVVLLEPLAQPTVQATELDAFGHFISEAFQQRRKTMGNAMARYRDAFEGAGINPSARPQEIPTENWVTLWRHTQR